MQWAGNNAANLTAGYSPVLTFEIRSMDETICEALQQGAFLDGSMKYMAVGKVYPYLLYIVSVHWLYFPAMLMSFIWWQCFYIYITGTVFIP